MRFWGHGHGHGGGPGFTGASLPPPGELSGELRYLDPSALNLRRQDGHLQIRRDWHEDWRDVTLVRMFPLSEPWRWIAVLDGWGRELGVVRDLAELPVAVRQEMRLELERRYLVPVIESVVGVSDRFDLVEWTVVTNRGRVSFLTRNMREEAQRPLPNHLTIVDVEGNRFDVPDLQALDPESRRQLESRM